MTYSEFRNRFSDVDSFMRAYGRLPAEEARALIDAENTSATAKACMMTTWHEARRKAKLWNVGIRIHNDQSLTVIFYENDSDFDGHDYEYRYSLDAESAAAFVSVIPRPYADMKTNIGEWLCENDLCGGLGGGLQEKWIRMGLHGSHVVFEDYPGGIYRETDF